MAKKKQAIIVGAGIGGLCTAARLLKNGYQVTIYEKDQNVGGRANRIVDGKYSFDIGPTLLMMTDILYDTFSYCGKDMKDYITLLQLEPNYRVTFADKSHITVSSNVVKFQEELSKIDPKGPEQFYRFFSDVAAMYRVARPNFVDKNFYKVTDFLNVWSGLQLLKRRGTKSLSSFVKRYFDDPRLQKLFSFQSMYLGVSPHEAPAVYSMISYMETGLGIWYPKGGMYSLSLGLAQLVRDMGGIIHTNTPITQIQVEHSHAKGVMLEDGTTKEADLVICNADMVYASQHLLPSTVKYKTTGRKLQKMKQSSSALLMYWAVNHDLDGLLHHNVYLSQNFDDNLNEVLHKHKLPTDPSFYLYVPTKTDPTIAPKGKQIMYILIPVPNLATNDDWEKGIARLRKQVLSRLQSVYGLDIAQHILKEHVFTPQDFATKYNLPLGSAFSLTHHFFQSGYFRPHNKSTNTKGLYFVGASTYPGGGVPMVSLSAKLVVERILHDNMK